MPNPIRPAGETQVAYLTAFRVVVGLALVGSAVITLSGASPAAVGLETPFLLLFIYCLTAATTRSLSSLAKRVAELEKPG